MDASVCVGDQLELNAVANGFNTFLWESSGSGIFTQPSFLNSEYEPSDEDFENGVIQLILFAENNESQLSRVILWSSPCIRSLRFQSSH